MLHIFGTPMPSTVQLSLDHVHFFSPLSPPPPTSSLRKELVKMWGGRGKGLKLTLHTRGLLPSHLSSSLPIPLRAVCYIHSCMLNSYYLRLVSHDKSNYVYELHTSIIRYHLPLLFLPPYPSLSLSPGLPSPPPPPSVFLPCLGLHTYFLMFRFCFY